MDLQELFDSAQIKRNNGEIEEAVVLYKQAREEAVKEDNKWLAVETLHQIGVAYYQAEKFQDAQEFLEVAKKEFEDLADQNLIGAVLRDMAMVARKQKDFVKAKNFINESIYKLTGNLGHMGMSQVKLGMILLEEGDLVGAEEKIKEGIANIQNSPERFFESLAFYNLAEVQKKMGKTKEAKESLKKSLEILDLISTKDQNVSLRKQMEDFDKDMNLA